MGNSASAATPPQIQSPTPAIDSKAAALAAPGEKPKCKACCACPETKKIRDQCVLEKGEENCGDLIEKHKQCMRDQGFNI